jgi:hypothetical protein
MRMVHGEADIGIQASGEGFRIVLAKNDTIC